jgi:hypothetical protein
VQAALHRLQNIDLIIDEYDANHCGSLLSRFRPLPASSRPRARQSAVE